MLIQRRHPGDKALLDRAIGERLVLHHCDHFGVLVLQILDPGHTLGLTFLGIRCMLLRGDSLGLFLIVFLRLLLPFFSIVGLQEAFEIGVDGVKLLLGELCFDLL